MNVGSFSARPALGRDLGGEGIGEALA